jgi:hypothetical protein
MNLFIFYFSYHYIFNNHINALQALYDYDIGQLHELSCIQLLLVAV